MFNNNRRTIIKQTATIHRHNIQRNIEHRLEVARMRGDRQLVSILEKEASLY